METVAGSTREITLRQQEKAELETLFQTLEIERKRLTSLFMRALAFIAVLKGPDHVFDLVNPPYYKLIGQRDIVGKPARLVRHDLQGECFYEKTPGGGAQVRIIFPLPPHLPDLLCAPHQTLLSGA